jgi:hypothetical protein
VPTEQFFEEILLTYRLIFGQDDRSYKAFSRMVPVWEEQRGRASWETTWACDPMLLILCGKSATSEEARKIYTEINANEPANCYNANTEFHFFGNRLLELQQFVKQHQPQNVRALLNDRRDVAAWYMLWNNQVRTLTFSLCDSSTILRHAQVLIIFATITIFLMILSLIFQAWQVMLTKQQLQQGQAP